MAEVIWNANGQGEFDFDYLLKITNENFVVEFEKDLKKYNFKFVEVFDNEYLVRLHAVDSRFLYIYSFDKLRKTKSFVLLNYMQLERYLEVIQDEK